MINVPFTQYKLGVWVTWRKWDTFLHWSVYVYSFGQYSVKYKTVTCFWIIFFFTLREEEIFSRQKFQTKSFIKSETLLNIIGTWIIACLKLFYTNERSLSKDSRASVGACTSDCSPSWLSLVCVIVSEWSTVLCTSYDHCEYS